MIVDQNWSLLGFKMLTYATAQRPFQNFANFSGFRITDLDIAKSQIQNTNDLPSLLHILFDLIHYQAVYKKGASLCKPITWSYLRRQHWVNPVELSKNLPCSAFNFPPPPPSKNGVIHQKLTVILRVTLQMFFMWGRGIHPVLNFEIKYVLCTKFRFNVLQFSITAYPAMRHAETGAYPRKNIGQECCWTGCQSIRDSAIRHCRLFVDTNTHKSQFRIVGKYIQPV